MILVLSLVILFLTESASLTKLTIFDYQVINKIAYICILKKITMGRIKEIYMEIQNQFGEDVEVTEQMFADFVNEMEKEKEKNEG